MSVNTNPLLVALIPYVPRVTVLPFMAALYLEGRFGLAVALTLLWHFIVMVPWKGLAHFDTADVRLAYFVVMPIVAIIHALAGTLLNRLLLILPWHLTPIGHVLSAIFRRPSDDEEEALANPKKISLPPSFLLASIIAAFVVVVGSWLPSELLTIYGYSPSSISGPLFWITIFVPPGAVILPLIIWLIYGSALANLFGVKHGVLNAFKTALKLFLSSVLVSLCAALIAKYATDFWLLYTAPIATVVTLCIAALIYYVFQHTVEKKQFFQRL